MKKTMKVAIAILMAVIRFIGTLKLISLHLLNSLCNVLLCRSCIQVYLLHNLFGVDCNDE